jgi:NAD(P)-dependent dehydrogenase (short-subunit alcohol dehydrogenase family)
MKPVTMPLLQRLLPCFSVRRSHRSWIGRMSDGKVHRFDGRVAVVTGAGAGLGRQHAHELARRGATVLVNDVAKDDDGSPIAEAIAAQFKREGLEAVGYTADVGIENNAEAVVRHAVDMFGRIDILINNAGNAISGPIWEISTEDFKAVLNVHLFGTFWTMRAALRHMRQANYGRIVNTASALGAFGAPHSAPYVTAKAGIIGLSKAAALDNAAADIRINSIAPIAYTNLAKDFFDNHPTVDVAKLTTAKVSPAVLYLAHESCSLNGELLSVAAGRVARICTITAPGLYSEDLTSEQLADNLGTVMDPTGYIVPGKSMDQYKLLKL